MANHPDLSAARDKPGTSPLPDHIRAAREVAGFTQTGAAALVHTSCRAWQQWEAGERRMHPAFWELFQRKVQETFDSRS